MKKRKWSHTLKDEGTAQEHRTEKMTLRMCDPCTYALVSFPDPPTKQRVGLGDGPIRVCSGEICGM